MDKDVRLPHAKSNLQAESSSPLPSSAFSVHANNGHVSTIDSSLLPPNWPKHVKYLVDYEYHPSIAPAILNLVQGKRRKKSNQNGSTNNATEVKETNQENNEQRDKLETEYDDIPIGHLIPGYLPSSNHLKAMSPVSASAMDLSSSLLAAINLADPQPTIAFSPAISSSSTATSASSFTANGPNATTTTTDKTTIPDQSSSAPPPYEIRLITGPPTHPVLGSYGLFATKLLRPGLHLLDYISLVVPDEHADPDSDHTLYLCNDLNLDASVHGNHGRFVNDFRGIRTQEQGPNVGWDLYRDAETGQVRMGCKVLKLIRKGEEIVCTYGKAYWKSRGIAVSGEEWEDGWDTDLEDGQDVPSDIDD
ncbi:hypothetical protein FBU30_003478 [Linnemannia zychae]|nr:hypothetical protein FBU30_003478 [Linnemannia zychae]